MCCAFNSLSQAQVVTITPKPQPIILRLDDNGKHTVIIDSLATATNPTDSVLKYKFRPAQFDCSTTGKKYVHVAAYTNGFKPEQIEASIKFQQPQSVLYDPAGNYYVADNGTNIIRRITPQGVVTIYAGTVNIGGYVDGPVANSKIQTVGGNCLAYDSDGTMYFSDAGNNRIRKISTDGIVSTVAGSGAASFRDGKGDQAAFNVPQSIVIDKHHNIYVCDLNNQVIRKVTTDGVVTTIAGRGFGTSDLPGGGAAALRLLRGMAIDSKGDLYVSDTPQDVFDKRNYIKKITPEGYVSTYFDPQFSDPDYDNNNILFEGLKCDEDDNLYVGYFSCLKKLTPAKKLYTIAGKINVPGNVAGPKEQARFTNIISIDKDPCGNLMIVDAVGGLSKIGTDGYVTKIFNIGGVYYTGTVNASTCQGAQIDVPVKVQSVPKFLNTFADVTLQDCANLANYIVKAGAVDNCPDNKLTVTQTPAPNSPIFNNVPVKVTLTATDTTGGIAVTSFMATAKYSAAPPGRSVTVSASNTAICAGDVVTFTANVINPDASPTYQWLVNGKNAGTNSPTFTSDKLADGDVINCAVTTGNGCGIPNLGLPVTMSVEDMPTIQLKTKDDIVAGNSIILKPKVTGKVVNYKWSPATGLSDPASETPLAKPDNTTTYTLTVYTANNCTAQASETINIINTVYPINTFTPNGDGVNDYWTISHLSDYTKSSLRVYGRTGVLIYEAIGYPNPWDGTVGGTNVPAGTYYYIIDLKDGSKPKTGEVTIIR